MFHFLEQYNIVQSCECRVMPSRRSSAYSGGRTRRRWSRDSWRTARTRCATLWKTRTKTSTREANGCWDAAGRGRGRGVRRAAAGPRQGRDDDRRRRGTELDRRAGVAAAAAPSTTTKTTADVVVSGCRQELPEYSPSYSVAQAVGILSPSRVDSQL